MGVAVFTLLGVLPGGANAQASSAPEGITAGGDSLVASSTATLCISSTEALIDRGLQNPGELLSGRIPEGFPRAVPIVRGSVVGGSIGRGGASWVVGVRVADANALTTITSQLKLAGFAMSFAEGDEDGALVGVFAKTNYCVAVLVWVGDDGGYIATYMVTTTNRVAPFPVYSNTKVRHEGDRVGEVIVGRVGRSTERTPRLRSSTQ